MDIERAAFLLKGVAHHTPLDRSVTFSEMAGLPVYLKLENLQKTGSFKIRGAYNKIAGLSAEEKRCGVIAASAGNHAQGVAYAASRAGIKATIVMPETAPLAKVSATKSYGAEVVLAGAGYDDAFTKAKEIQLFQGMTFVHAFNDSAVMAGQGTIALEILKDLPEVASIIVPVGGGGLIAGIAAAVKERAPHIRIFGVQAAGAPAASLSKHKGQRVITATAVTIADGIAVKEPGDETYPYIEKWVDDIVTVDDEAIASAILMLLERAKLVVEGAGAVGLAAVIQQKLPLCGPTAVLISGGNIDVNFISRIIERGLVKAGRRAVLITSVVDRPGALQRLLGIIANSGGNVIHISHNRVDHQVPLGQAEVQVSIETRNTAHTEEILAVMRREGYEVSVR